MDKLASIDDDTFKAWFAYNKDQFKQICSFIEICKCLLVSSYVLLFPINSELFCLEQMITNYINLARE